MGTDKKVLQFSVTYIDYNYYIDYHATKCPVSRGAHNHYIILVCIEFIVELIFHVQCDHAMYCSCFDIRTQNNEIIIQFYQIMRWLLAGRYQAFFPQ